MNRTKTNTWRKIQGKEPLKPMIEVVTHLTKYVSTYNEQAGFEEYTDELFINDILYGLGVSLNEDNQFAQGFRKFKQELLTHLQNDPETQTEEVL